MLRVILWSLVLALIINGAMFLVAFRLKSDKLTDASYALTFIALAIFDFTYSSHNPYSIIGLLLVILWAIRIGSFLLYRVIRSGSDKRFDNMREHFWKFGRFWLGQAITIWVLMIPVALALSAKPSWHGLAIAGTIIWLIGFATESLADQQKYHFTHNPAHKNHWIDCGLWRYSRHPNYLGEILVWVGIYIYALPNLNLIGKLVSLVSPLLIVILLMFISGIPVLEKSADKHWGNDPAYRDYKRRTSLLLLLPRKN